MKEVESAQPLSSDVVEGTYLPQGDVYLGEVKIDQPNDDSGLKSKKFIVTMLLLVVSSLFTGMGIMTIDQWLWFDGAIAAGYGILNVGQKKLLQ